MSTRPRSVDRTAVVAAVAVPAIVGVVAVLQGYPVPRGASAIAMTAVTGAALSLLGLVAWWTYDRRRRSGTVVAVGAIAGAVAWSSIASGVDAVRLGENVVLAGSPLLARFAGVTPWVVVAVGAVALVDPGRSRRSTTGRNRPSVTRDRPRSRALRLAVAGGAAVAVLAVLPAYLVGTGVGSSALLGFALAGGFVAATLVGYLFVRHRFVSPLLVLGIVAAGASVAVTAGGSPRGFPTAWPVWFVPGLVVGGFEAVARYVRGRVRDS